MGPHTRSDSSSVDRHFSKHSPHTPTITLHFTSLHITSHRRASRHTHLTLTHTHTYHTRTYHTPINSAATFASPRTTATRARTSSGTNTPPEDREGLREGMRQRETSDKQQHPSDSTKHTAHNTHKLNTHIHSLCQRDFRLISPRR